MVNRRECGVFSINQYSKHKLYKLYPLDYNQQILNKHARKASVKEDKIINVLQTAQRKEEN